MPIYTSSSRNTHDAPPVRQPAPPRPPTTQANVHLMPGDTYNGIYVHQAQDFTPLPGHVLQRSGEQRPTIYNADSQNFVSLRGVIPSIPIGTSHTIGLQRHIDVSPDHALLTGGRITNLSPNFVTTLNGRELASSESVSTRDSDLIGIGLQAVFSNRYGSTGTLDPVHPGESSQAPLRFTGTPHGAPMTPDEATAANLRGLDRVAAQFANFPDNKDTLPDWLKAMQRRHR